MTNRPDDNLEVFETETTFEILLNHDDPGIAEMEKEITPETKLHIIEIFKANKEKWGNIESAQANQKFAPNNLIEIDNRPYIIKIELSEDPKVRSRKMLIYPISNAAKARIEELRHIFGESIFQDQSSDREGFSVRKIATQINAKPRKEYKKTQDFNIMSIKDEVHGPVIPQVMLLVKYLNNMGIETTNSGWGGPAHSANIWGEWREEDGKPYLAIDGKNLKDIVEVLLDWENNGGKDLRIIPIGGHMAHGFWIMPNQETSWQEAQKEFDSLTDHIAWRFGKSDEIRRLISKKLIHAITKMTPSITSAVQIARKGIRKILPEKRHDHHNHHHDEHGSNSLNNDNH